MHRIVMALAMGLLANAAPAFAVGADDPRACVTPDSRTADEMAECLHTAGTEADRRLNETYQQALAALDAESATLLRAAQRQWVAFREADLKAQQAPFRARRSTALRIDLTLANVEAINSRERALRLYQPE